VPAVPAVFGAPPELAVPPAPPPEAAPFDVPPPGVPGVLPAEPPDPPLAGEVPPAPLPAAAESTGAGPPGSQPAWTRGRVRRAATAAKHRTVYPPEPKSTAEGRSVSELLTQGAHENHLYPGTSSAIGPSAARTLRLVKPRLGQRNRASARPDAAARRRVAVSAIGPRPLFAARDRPLDPDAVACGTASRTVCAGPSTGRRQRPFRARIDDSAAEQLPTGAAALRHPPIRAPVEGVSGYGRHSLWPGRISFAG